MFQLFYPYVENDHEHFHFQVNNLGPGSIIGLEQAIFDIPSFEFILPAEKDIWIVSDAHIPVIYNF